MNNILAKKQREYVDWFNKHRYSGVKWIGERYHKTGVRQRIKKMDSYLEDIDRLLSFMYSDRENNSNNDYHSYLHKIFRIAISHSPVSKPKEIFESALSTFEPTPKQLHVAMRFLTKRKIIWNRLKQFGFHKLKVWEGDIIEIYIFDTFKQKSIKSFERIISKLRKTDLEKPLTDIQNLKLIKKYVDIFEKVCNSSTPLPSDAIDSSMIGRKAKGIDIICSWFENNGIFVSKKIGDAKYWAITPYGRELKKFLW